MQEPTPVEAELSSPDPRISRRVFIGMGAILAGAISITDFIATGDVAFAAPSWAFPFTFRPRIERGLQYSGGTLSHEGVDYTPGSGTPIYSIAAGTITVSGVSGDGGAYGQSVWVNHGGGWTSRYAHMRDGSRRVSVGQSIARGQQLGEVGSTGRSTGPHLHLEMRLDNAVQDPIALLANAPLAGSAPAPQSTNGSMEDLMYMRRQSTGEIAIFGGSFRQGSGGTTGRHVFGNLDEYNAWRRIVTTYNSEARRLGLPTQNLVPEPPASSGDVLGLTEGDWAVFCGVYGV